MTYSQVKEYLYSFINYESLYKYSYKKSFKLDRFSSFLKEIDSPQINLKIIHVAGSKGKGSVCISIAHILKQAGFKVGLYTSPHLVDFRERIRILQKPEAKSQQPEEFEGMISKKEICRLTEELKPRIDKFNKKSRRGALTFFEVYTALALKYFQERKVDFVVLETGLGGRLDATNACAAILSLITPISLEHTFLLGKGLKQIAFEKASIIKKENQKARGGRAIALTSKQAPAVESLIEKISRRNKTLLFKQDRDFWVKQSRDKCFDYQGLNGKIEKLSINLTGRHQIANAALAIASIEALSYHGIDVGNSAIRAGLKNCIWPARFEIISKNPTIILDGAQNSASVKALGRTLKENYSESRIWVIFGLARDKELQDTCRALEGISQDIVLTKSQNPRAAEPLELARYFKSKPVYLANTLSAALEFAESVSIQRDIILITGSLYLCGEAKLLINGPRIF